MKNNHTLTRRVAYITSSIVNNYRAHAIQVMKNAQAWNHLVDDFELITNLTASQWCRFDIAQIAHHYGLSRPPAITVFPLGGWEDSRHLPLSTLYYRLAALRCRGRGVTLAYCRSYEAAYWLTRFGVMTVMESHGIPPNPRHLAALPAISKNPFFAGLVTITPPLATGFQQAGVPAEKILVLPDGVDLERFAQPLSQDDARLLTKLPGNKPLAVYTGHLYQGRGIEDILEAASLLPHIHFALVGGLPKDVIHWQQITTSRRLANVQFLGHVANQDLPPYLWAADVLLMPYSVRCPTVLWMSPMKMFEYMAAGRPIVASDLPAIRAVLAHRHNAWLTPADQGREMAHALIELLSQPVVARSIAHQAMADVVDYDWNRRVAQVVDFLRGRS